MLRDLLARMFGRVIRGAGGPAPEDGMTYERARELARHRDPEVRRSLAARGDVRPEILYYLAGDPHPEVRRQIASNYATPPQADLKLAKDTDPDVRGDLAHKIARLAPGLSADEQDRLRRLTYETLELLARDQIPRVRQIVAEALKDVAHVPPEVIRHLAHDSEIVVAGPVLECSPVLTDDDLLEIIHSYPSSAALSAISRRQPVYADVAEAVARSEDEGAIAVLLANDSAQIREETLDMLLERAPLHESWHGPLVRRPHLSAMAVTRLARFVAESLLQTLAERPELDDVTREAVFAEVRRRIDQGGGAVGGRRGGDGADGGAESALERARCLMRDGRLDEQNVLSALIDDDIALIRAALQLRAGVTAELVSRVIAARSAKGVIALAWKAGMSASTAAQLQTALARVAPSDVLAPTHDGGFPLTQTEMEWQLDFFAALCADASASGGPGAL